MLINFHFSFSVDQFSQRFYQVTFSKSKWKNLCENWSTEKLDFDFSLTWVSPTENFLWLKIFWKVASRSERKVRGVTNSSVTDVDQLSFHFWLSKILMTSFSKSKWKNLCENWSTEKLDFDFSLTSVSLSVYEVNWSTEKIDFDFSLTWGSLIKTTDGCAGGCTTNRSNNPRTHRLASPHTQSPRNERPKIEKNTSADTHPRSHSWRKCTRPRCCRKSPQLAQRQKGDDGQSSTSYPRDGNGFAGTSRESRAWNSSVRIHPYAGKGSSLALGPSPLDAW